MYCCRNLGFQFEPVSTYLRGGFSWRLNFFWEWLPPRDIARRLRDPTSTFSTPAIAGGLFAIDKNWFLELGAYDMGKRISCFYNHDWKHFLSKDDTLSDLTC